MAVRYPTPAPRALDEALAGKIDGWLRALSAGAFAKREEATRELARYYYSARSRIEAALGASREAEVVARAKTIRRHGAERYAPILVSYPLRKGRKWTDHTGKPAEVLEAGDVKTGAWKIRIGKRVIWWSATQHIPLAIEEGTARWELE